MFCLCDVSHEESSKLLFGTFKGAEGFMARSVSLPPPPWRLRFIFQFLFVLRSQKVLNKIQQEVQPQRKNW